MYKSLQTFIRKGAVGDWKNHFPAEILEAWDEWIEMKRVEHEIEYKF